MTVEPARTLLAAMLFAAATSILSGAEPSPRSIPIADVLRQPLPAENLTLREAPREWIVDGPTFTYRASRQSGTIAGVDVRRGAANVLTMPAPMTVRLDDYSTDALVDGNSAELVSADAGKVVLLSAGRLQGSPPLPVTLETTIFSDGVVVTRVTVTPSAELTIRQGIDATVEFQGRLDRYLHKCHERYDSDAGGAMLPLPEIGQSVDAASTTSCLQLMSHDAAVAIFTDLGAYHINPAGQATASIERQVCNVDRQARVKLTQRIARVGNGGAPLVLPAGQPFTFRVGMCVAPQRHPHPRSMELRHFTWIGDDRFPYPTNEEIAQVAQLGFSVFQMHRLGLISQPRPPRGELERVITKVHEHGMLFLLLTLPDLLDAHSPRLQQMQADGTWYLWEANNYGGRYTATMDSYCDYYGTCVGAPNGLNDYHIESAAQMINRFDVDGIYLDDNITQGPHCPHWEAHGHPRPGYDCLIEIHEVNWRRRRFLLERVPHLLLVDHCTIGQWLPLLAPFDVHLYGEGHGILALDDYWNFYGMISSMNAHGNLWPGGLDGARFATPGAYVLDMLTGGGQYAYIDWRLFTDKFSYAAGVLSNEKALVRAFNLAQYYFGMHEATPYIYTALRGAIGGSNAATAVAAYRNETWGDSLLVVGNTTSNVVTDSIAIDAPEALAIDRNGYYGLFDVFERTYRQSRGDLISKSLANLVLPGDGVRLFNMRPAVGDRPQHVWGGKRLDELWNPVERRLTVRLSAPAGLTDSIFISPGQKPIAWVSVNGRPADFAMNKDGSLLHGEVVFRGDPALVEVQLGEPAAAWPFREASRLTLYDEPKDARRVSGTSKRGSGMIRIEP